ncbi:MAG: alpha/beta fold hydrolase [Pararhodobacter sp.]
MGMGRSRYVHFPRRHDRLLSTLAERLKRDETNGIDPEDLRAASDLLADAQPRGGATRAWLLVHPDGRMIDCSARAAEMFRLGRPGDRLHGIGDRLLRSPGGKDVLLIEDMAGQPVLLRALRMPDRQTWQLDEAPDATSPWFRDAIMSFWQLTPGEADMAEALLHGKTSEQIAAETGRTIGTVRQVIKAILAKMHVGSQPQAVARLASVAIAYARISQTSDEFPARRLHPYHGANAAPLAYWRYGETGGRPLLFFHGALFGVAGRAAVASEARLFGFDVIAPERPGYGETPLERNRDPVALSVARAKAVLDMEGIERVQLLAHDVGSVYAFAFARACPERVSGIVCAPATPPMLNWSQTADMPPLHRVSAFATQKAPALMETLVMLGLRRIAREGLAAIPRLVFADSHHDRDVMLRPDAYQVLEHLHRFALEQEATGFVQDMFVTNRNWSDWLGEIACPVILLHGQKSRTVSAKALQVMCERLPDATLQIIPDAGHTLPISHPTHALRAALRLGHR